MRLFLAMLPRRSITTLCRLPAGMGALYGDNAPGPKEDELPPEGAAVPVGLALATWLPLLGLAASDRASSSGVALAEFSPRLRTLSPESTKAFLQPHALPHELPDMQM